MFQALSFRFRTALSAVVMAVAALAFFVTPATAVTNSTPCGQPGALVEQGGVHYLCRHGGYDYQGGHVLGYHWEACREYTNGNCAVY